MKLRNTVIKPARIEMLPLIDIVFLLLVFFIYAMLSMAVHRTLPVDLPSSTTVQRDTKKTIDLTIQATDGGIDIFVDKQAVELDRLTDTLIENKTSMKESDPEVQIYGDKAVSYQQLFDVLDRIKSAGLNRISLAAEVESK